MKGIRPKTNVSILLTNGHCTSIDNQNVKHDIIYKNKIDLKKIDFNEECTNYVLINENNIDDVINGTINNNIILYDGL